MTDPRLRRFRLRVLIAAGVMFSPGSLIRAARAGGGSSTGGGSSSGGSDGSASGSSSSGSSSSGSSASGGSSSGSSSEGGPPSTTINPSTSAADTDGPARDTDSTDDGGFVCGGCYGRPYIAQSQVRTASVTPGEAWSWPIAAPALDGATEAQREALTAFWTTAALSEHSSVAGFHRFVLDLLAHGAPPQLIARAQRAAIEELEHARACFALAGAYGGRAIGPGPMPLGTAAPIAPTLVELAVWTVHEGCVGETVAAWLASEIHEHCEDPVVREVMAKIASEEAEHAELSWATLRWAMRTGGDAVRDATAEAFATARVAPPVHGSIFCQAHGLLAPARIDTAVRRAFSAVVRPCAAQILAA